MSTLKIFNLSQFISQHHPNLSHLYLLGQEDPLEKEMAAHSSILA